MRVPILLLYFTALIPLTLAIPMNPTKSTETSTPVTSSSSASSSSHSASASPTLPPYACPKNQYKKCCQSVQGESKELIKPLGQLVPILNGLQISSVLSFQCNPMSDKEAPNNCQYSAMCCAEQSSGLVSSCKPFAQAKEEAEKKESKAQMINDVMS